MLCTKSFAGFQIYLVALWNKASSIVFVLVLVPIFLHFRVFVLILFVLVLVLLFLHLRVFVLILFVLVFALLFLHLRVFVFLLFFLVLVLVFLLPLLLLIFCYSQNTHKTTYGFCLVKTVKVFYKSPKKKKKKKKEKERTEGNYETTM